MWLFSPHKAYPEDLLQPELIQWWTHARGTAMLLLTSPKYRKKLVWSDSSDNILIYPPTHYRKRDILNGRKLKNQSRLNSGRAEQSAPIEWLDGLLAAEDLSVLGSDEATLEHLACRLISLVADGYGVAVKYNSEREQYNCTIYRPPYGDERRHLGLSGFSPDLRDALLVTVYRFDVIFGGRINDSSVDDTRVKQKRRFG